MAEKTLRKQSVEPALIPVVAAIFYAPLAFGCTTATTVAVLDGLLLLSFAIWMVRKLVSRQLPAIPPLCFAALATLVAIGVTSWLNPRSQHSADSWEFFSLPNAIDWLPGTIDAQATSANILNLAAMLAVFLVILDRLKYPHNRWMLLRAIALSGMVVAVIGIAQKAGGSTAMLWATPENSGLTFFAAFRYHGNAASFLNLSWPAAAALWLRHSRDEAPTYHGPLWLTVLLVTLIALFANTSKAGQVIAAVGLIWLLFRFRRNFVAAAGSTRRLIGASILFAGLLIVAVLPSLAVSSERWSELFSTSRSLEGRMVVYQVCLQMLPDSGWFGMGPGTFRLAFPFYTNHLGNQIGGFWHHAHQDYLQTLIEWGYIGASAWGLLFLGAFSKGIRRTFIASRRKISQYSTLCALLAMTLVLTHAVIDFPLQIPALQLLVAVYLALLWALKAGVKTKT